MDEQFINLSPENLSEQHLCCIIRSKKPHPGVEAKRQWLAQRLREGHVFRKLDAKATVFIEYAPLETAWVPVAGGNFLYIYCLWVLGDYKGKGYGRALMLDLIQTALLHGADRMTLEVREHNQAAQALYKGLGFETAGRRKKYYSDTGEDAFIMWNDHLAAQVAPPQFHI